VTATIVVIAKEPRPGRVKTRLCPPCTLEDAARIARAALRDTLDAISETSAAEHVIALDGAPGAWLPARFRVVRQVDGDLSVRLAAATGAITAPVLVVGMDTPQVTPALLAQACLPLEDPDVDAVLGRAEDGGYWAIGFRDRRAGAFDGVPMSSPTTAEVQHARLQALGFRVRELPRLRDVDTFDDALAVAALIPRSRFARVVADVATRHEVAA
jgi:hypothetical protein